MAALRRFSNKMTRKKKDGEDGKGGDDEDTIIDEELAKAKSTDPSVAFVKQAAFFGRSRRRWFVLHRTHHKLAYYAKPFVPPENGELKGVIDLATVVDATNAGKKVEVKIAKGRSPYKLLADNEKIAKDWVKLIKMESHLAGLDNPLQKLVTDACKPDNGPEDGTDLYLEYGGFKFAADEDPALYTDFDPSVNRTEGGGGGGGAPVDEEAGYLDKEAADPDVDELADDYVPGQLPADDGYLEQQAGTGGSGGGGVQADEDGYLEQRAPGGDIDADADNYVPPELSPETTYGEPEADADAGPADLDDAGYLEQQAAANGTVDADDYVPDEATSGAPQAEDGGEATAAPEEQVAETGEPVTATEELAASE